MNGGEKARFPGFLYEQTRYKKIESNSALTGSNLVISEHPLDRNVKSIAPQYSLISLK